MPKTTDYWSEVGKGLAALNSLTKYPSIPTYHEIDRGILLDNHLGYKLGEKYIVTEKIDGTNARIIFLPRGFKGLQKPMYILGSRENLLYGQGDLIGDPAQGIVAGLRDTVDHLMENVSEQTEIHVLFGEFYGAKVGSASKNYSNDDRFGFRLFDIAQYRDAETLLDKPLEEISTWRDHTGPQWSNEADLHGLSDIFQLPLTPRLDTRIDLWEAHEEVLQYLKKFSQTAAGLSASGASEGIVVRSLGRSFIAKLRFEDYEKTLRKKPK
jgi:hypothetical protein